MKIILSILAGVFIVVLFRMCSTPEECAAARLAYDSRYGVAASQVGGIEQEAEAKRKVELACGPRDPAR